MKFMTKGKLQDCHYAFDYYFYLFIFNPDLVSGGSFSVLFEGR